MTINSPLIEEKHNLIRRLENPKLSEQERDDIEKRIQVINIEITRIREQVMNR